MIVVGLMSGSAADAIDAVAAEIGEERPRPRVRALARAPRLSPRRSGPRCPVPARASQWNAFSWPLFQRYFVRGLTSGAVKG